MWWAKKRDVGVHDVKIKQTSSTTADHAKAMQSGVKTHMPLGSLFNGELFEIFWGLE